MTASTAASRRHAQRQVAVVVGLVGASLAVLAGGLALAPNSEVGDEPTAGSAPTSGASSAMEAAPPVVTPRPSSTSTASTTPAPPPPPTATRSPSSPPTAAPPEPPAVPAARPGSVEIPAIGVVSDLVDLDLDETRHLEVPSDPAVAGWYVRGPRPGEDGPAVIAGHVDSTRGPGVFWRLRDVQPGDDLRIHRIDGTVVTFVVDRIGRWPKSAFPTDQVYRRADGPELRLITCGGVFDERAGSYVDNVVVFASLRAST